MTEIFGIALGIGLGLVAIFILSCLIFFYGLPTYIARVRRHPHFRAIALVNLLTGWTFLGWAAALIWAFVDERTVGQI